MCVLLCCCCCCSCSFVYRDVANKNRRKKYCISSAQTNNAWLAIYATHRPQSHNTSTTIFSWRGFSSLRDGKTPVSTTYQWPPFPTTLRPHAVLQQYSTALGSMAVRRAYVYHTPAGVVCYTTVAIGRYASFSTPTKGWAFAYN